MRDDQRLIPLSGSPCFPGHSARMEGGEEEGRGRGGKRGGRENHRGGRGGGEGLLRLAQSPPVRCLPEPRVTAQYDTLYTIWVCLFN